MTSAKQIEHSLSAFKGHWALVTGASAGIGKEYAYQLAQAGMNVVLVARRGELLNELATELHEKFSVRTFTLALDLTQKKAVQELRKSLQEADIHIRFLCNNAGVGRWGRFENASVEVYQEMLSLNIGVMVSMCHQFMSDLVSFPSSVIVNVSSPAGYQPVPYMAVYAATKAFVQSFSQALHGEWGEKGVLVQTLVPGPTETEFDAKAQAYESALTKRGSTTEVVHASLKALSSGEPIAAATKGLYRQRFFAGLFPARMVIREVAKMFKPPV
jgi:hypothetical protein